VSELPATELLLLPSRMRRRLLLLPTLGCAALSVLLAGAGTMPARLAAAACALAAALALRALLRREGLRRVQLHPAGAAAPRVEHVGTTRIVLRTAQGRVVVWRDAIDPGRFRRLAVAARWPARGTIR